MNFDNIYNPDSWINGSETEEEPIQENEFVKNTRPIQVGNTLALSKTEVEEWLKSLEKANREL